MLFVSVLWRRRFPSKWWSVEKVIEVPGKIVEEHAVPKVKEFSVDVVKEKVVEKEVPPEGERLRRHMKFQLILFARR